MNNFLKKKNIDSEICYFSSKDGSFNLEAKNNITKFTHKISNSCRNKLINYLKKDKNFAFFGNAFLSNLKNIIQNFSPDIVHFHWLPRTLNLEELLDIKSKIIWTIRDFWPFTGGCNVPLFCEKYLSHCGNCPHLKFSINKDISYFNFKKKKNIYQKLQNITLTFPCSDFDKIHKKSILKNIKNTFIIPNSFKNIEFTKNIRVNNKIKIAFGAQNLDQAWKGADIFFDIISKISNPNYEFLVFGSTKKYKKKLSAPNIKYFNYVNSDGVRNILSSADILIFPSYYESFGKLILESLSCGTPVIAKKKIGAKDILNHKINGYLLDNNNAEDYIKGIEFILKQNKKTLLNNCRLKSEEYSIEKIGSQFIKLYNNI